MATIRPDSLTNTISSPTLSSKPLPSSSLSGSKLPKVAATAQRIDYEPIYVQLRQAIGDKDWQPYKEAVGSFILGALNQTELSRQIDPIIQGDPNRLHLHNQFLSAVFGNASRDPPEPGVASWVSANDKPSIAPKPAAGDVAEQRLKTEVMQLTGRERKRLKQIQEDPTDLFTKTMTDYHNARSIRPPDTGPASAGGFNNKTNWELEIRKRYAQPLFSETNEFPTAETIQARMVPICYEEGVVNGAAAGCAEFMNVAAEFYIKEVLTSLFVKVSSNGGSGQSFIKTAAYKKQLEKEEEGWLKGEVTKNAGGLLPIEAEEASKRKALTMSDLKLAYSLGDPYLGQVPLISGQILNSRWAEEFEERDEEEEPPIRAIDMARSRSTQTMAKGVNGVNKANGVNGVNGHAHDPDDMDIDEHWQGATPRDFAAVGSLLDECLAIGE